MVALHAYDTWHPLLRTAYDSDPAGFSCPGAGFAGRVTRDLGTWSSFAGSGDNLDGFLKNFTPELAAEVLGRPQAALRQTPMDCMSFVVTYPGPRRARIHLLEFSSAVEDIGVGTGLGSVVLVEGAVAAWWKRLPELVPGARPADSADPELLARTLRARFPGAAGASDAAITAAGRRIGTAFPAELRAFYRALPPGASRRDIGIPLDPLPVDEVFVGTAEARKIPWTYASEHPAPATAPGAAVQMLAGSPGWLVFADIGNEGQQLAIDLTPGPGGHQGQVIILHPFHCDAPTRLTDSLTQLIVHRRHLIDTDPLPGLPVLANVSWRGVPDVESALSPDLEILCIYRMNGRPPVSLAALAGHPGLRTLIAEPGTLADPRQIAALPYLEYLQIGIADWRTLLRSRLVPRSLLAAGVAEPWYQNPLGAVEINNALLELRSRPKIRQTVLEGRI